MYITYIQIIPKVDIVNAIHFIVVAKSKMYWQGVKKNAFDVKDHS